MISSAGLFLIILFIVIIIFVMSGNNKQKKYVDEIKTYSNYLFVYSSAC